jgi:hypothetical protein
MLVAFLTLRTCRSFYCTVDNDCAFVEDKGWLQQEDQEKDAMLVQEQGGREEENTLLQQEQDAVGPCVSKQV